MSRGRSRSTNVRVPFWLMLLALIPIGVFLVSLLAAGGIALLALAAFALFGRLFAAPSADESLGPRREDGRGSIELDPSEYRRIPDTNERDRS